jgi:hypothetical protein
VNDRLRRLVEFVGEPTWREVLEPLIPNPIEERVLGSVLEALALDFQERVQIDLSAIKGWRRAVRIRKTLEERRCGAGSLALAERPVPLAQ